MFLRETQGVCAFTGALVHPSATGSERGRHAAFIGRTLAVSFATLAFAPFFLAFHGAPSGAEILVLVLGLLPMAAAMLVARTAHLRGGRILYVGGLVAVGLTLFLGWHAGAGCAIVWLVVAELEAALSLDIALLSGAGLAIALVGGAIIILSLDSGFAASTSPATGAAVLAFAALHAFASLRGLLASVGAITREERARGKRDQTIAATFGDAVIGLEMRGDVSHVSGECKTLLEAPGNALMGRGLFDHVHVADRPAFLKLVADAGHDGETTASATVRLRTGPECAEPRHRWIEMRARRLAADCGTLDESGATTVVAVLRDITTFRQHEFERDAARRSIETAVRSKDDFLANVSHELRTPLNAIIGFSEMLGSQTLRPDSPDKQREYARIINQSGQHLLSVVNSILDMSKIQSGTFEIVAEPFDVVPLIDLCCDMVKLKALDGRIRLLRDYPATLEEVVGDKRACKQILINLLSNAVKFTPENGQVTIGARPDGNTLVLTVSDTGIGIAAADLDRLGDPFFQARSSLSRPFEGTGLGLSVVRGLIGLHGGTISVESELGKGTSVTIRLPLDCRAIRQKSASATIETIARRRAPEPVARSPEPRMKQSA